MLLELSYHITEFFERIIALQCFSIDDNVFGYFRRQRFTVFFTVDIPSNENC